MTNTKQALADANACYDAAAYGLARAVRASARPDADAILARAIAALSAARDGVAEAEAAVTDPTHERTRP